MLSYIHGYITLLTFYIRHLSTFSSLPPWIRNPNELKAHLDKNSRPSLSLSLPLTAATTYNNDYNKLKEFIRNLHPGPHPFSFHRQVSLLFLIRLLVIISASMGNFTATAALSFLQIIIAPYSFFAALTLFIAYGPPIYAAHYMSFGAITLIGRLSYKITSAWHITQGLADSLADLCNVLAVPVGPTFILLFFVVDQLLCIWAHHRTDHVKMRLKETIKHVVWGFINTKTFYLVVLLHLNSQNFSIPLVVCFIDYYFCLTEYFGHLISSLWLDTEALFYHQHRMGHLPRVYEHGHKMHHHLHGTAAFDGAVYGHGMPEEMLTLLLEVGASWYMGITPALFNWFIIKMSFYNKFSHIQKSEDCTGENYHALHHLLHVKNFGFVNCLTDMYFGTSHQNDKYVLSTLSVPGEQRTTNIFDVVKSVEEDTVRFTFTQRMEN